MQDSIIHLEKEGIIENMKYMELSRKADLHGSFYSNLLRFFFYVHI